MQTEATTSNRAKVVRRFIFETLGIGIAIKVLGSLVVGLEEHALFEWVNGEIAYFTHIEAPSLANLTALAKGWVGPLVCGVLVVTIYHFIMQRRLRRAPELKPAPARMSVTVQSTADPQQPRKRKPMAEIRLEYIRDQGFSFPHVRGIEKITAPKDPCKAYQAHIITCTFKLEEGPFQIVTILSAPKRRACSTRL
jgi:hypothetical protein